MRTRWRVAVIAALGLLALYAALPTLSGLPALRTWILARLAGASTSQIQFERLRINYDLSATLDGLSVAEAGRDPFLTADRVLLSLRPLALWGGQALRVRVERPHLHIAELPTQAAGGGGAPPLSLDRAEVVDLVVHPSPGEGATIGPLSLELSSVQGAAGQLTLSGGGPLPQSAGTVSWSAEIGATLPASHGSLTLDAAAPLDALQPWLAVELPPAVRPTGALLQVDLRGTESGRIAVALQGAIQLPIAKDAVRLTGTGELDPATRSAKLVLSGSPLAFQSDDATRVASGIEPQLELAVQRGDASGAQLDATIKLPRGELLWDRFYVDLRKHPLTLRGQLSTSPVQLALTRGSIAMSGIGTVKVAGTYDVPKQREHLRIEFAVPRLAPAYDLAVREPLQAEYPLLGRVALSGAASGAIELQRLAGGGRQVGGFIDLTGASLRTTDPAVDIPALEMHLPLDLSESPAASDRVQNGSLRVRGLRVADVAVGDVTLPLRVARNQVATAEPVRVPLLGGAFEIAHLRAMNLTGEPQVSVGLALHDLDLGEAARALQWPPLSGRVVGQIPDVTIDRHAALSEGEIRMDVFGGSVRMRNLRVEEPLSPVPTLRLDLDFADILLAEVTRTFEVGRISGVVKGGVANLEIANSQAARFEGWMETVERSGVSQRISVTAIRQLSILGGAGGDPISLGVLGFFDEYRYAKMGFRCSLENDRFTLQGVEQKDGAEYLVVGTTLPPRVNVISHTRVISFSELVQRLSRLMTLSEGKPATEAPVDEAAPATETPD